MANTAYAAPVILTDPGFLYWAPLGSTLPANTVAGSVFTDSWPAAWIGLGLTDAGSKLTSTLTTSPIDAAELLDPIAYRTTGRTTGLTFMLKNFTATNMSRAMNGATTVVTGAGATLLTKVSPPAQGTEVRAMIGYESLDSTYRFVAYQVLNQGNMELDFNEAPANTNVPWDLQLEKPAATQPYDQWFAGAARA